MFLPSAVALSGELFEMVTGNSGGTVGYSDGNYGTLDPLEFKGERVSAWVTSSNGGTNTFQFNQGGLPADFWNTMTWTGDFGSGQETVIWSRVNFVFSAPGGTSSWQDLTSTNPAMISGNTYQVTIG